MTESVQPQEPTQPPLQQQYEEWMKEHNAVHVVECIAPITSERVNIINLMALNWRIDVRVIERPQ